MKHRDPAAVHSLSSHAASRRISHPNTPDRALAMRELAAAVQKRHAALIAAEATIFTDGIEIRDGLSTQIYALRPHKTSPLGPARDTLVGRYRILDQGEFFALPIAIWQCLAIKLLGRRRLVERTCDRIFRDLSAVEARMVAGLEAPEPAGWLRHVERSGLDECCAPAKASGAARI